MVDKHQKTDSFRISEFLGFFLPYNITGLANSDEPRMRTRYATVRHGTVGDFDALGAGAAQDFVGVVDPRCCPRASQQTELLKFSRGNVGDQINIKLIFNQSMNLLES